MKKTEQTTAPTTQSIAIRPPNFGIAVFEIHGTAPLVIHRFSHKVKQQMADKQSGKVVAKGKKDRTAKDPKELFNESRYISPEGWDGFHAAAIRNAMIRACTLVDYKMTLAKMSVFVVQDGWDEKEPQIPLVRIYGKAVLQEDVARVETGQPYVTIRAAYHDWKAKLKIRWDADQFSLTDITNLLMRVGMQVGIGEGRAFSKDSAGCGWGSFEITKTEN